MVGQVESRLRFLLDKNIPLAVAAWLRIRHPRWAVFHPEEVGLLGISDSDISNGRKIIDASS